MNRINLDFTMARYDEEDIVLRAIAKEALNFLLENMDTNRIKCILLTGSIANGEGTVIQCNSSMITSDFDFVIYLDFPYFLKNRTHLRNLSQKMSTRLRERGMKTHVEFLPSTNVLRAGACFTNPSIYEYEFAFASKYIFGKAPSFNKTARPSKRDALELAFTVVSDLVFSRFKNVSKIEESYIYAKRALTLLNSILIFHGFFAETYEKRIQIAKRYAHAGIFPINEDEMKILELFTEYKLSGSFRSFLDSLACKKTDDLIRFQREFLKKLTIKILRYELLNILNKATETNLTCGSSLKNMTLEFPQLLEEYVKRSKTRLFSRIMGVILCLFWSITRNKTRKELFSTFIFHKQSPKIILNAAITFLFIRECDLSAAKILRKTFPWIDFNSEAIKKIYSLWQIVEQSIKLD